jgi:hypothetical protein
MRCGRCQGKGVLPRQHPTVAGFPLCPDCMGVGSVDPCDVGPGVEADLKFDVEDGYRRSGAMLNAIANKEGCQAKSNIAVASRTIASADAGEE